MYNPWCKVRVQLTYGLIVISIALNIAFAQPGLGWVEVGKDSDHTYYMRESEYRGSPAEKAAEHYKQAQREADACKKALRSLGFLLTTERFELIEKTAREQNSVLEERILKKSLDEGLSIARALAESATMIKFTEIMKGGRNLHNLVAELKKDPAYLHVPLGLLKFAQKFANNGSQWGWIVSCVEFGESLAYLAYLGDEIAELDGVVNGKLIELQGLSQRLSNAVERMKIALVEWRTATGNGRGEPELTGLKGRLTAQDRVIPLRKVKVLPASREVTPSSPASSISLIAPLALPVGGSRDGEAKAGRTQSDTPQSAAAIRLEGSALVTDRVAVRVLGRDKHQQVMDVGRKGVGSSTSKALEQLIECERAKLSLGVGSPSTVAQFDGSRPRSASVVEGAGPTTPVRVTSRVRETTSEGAKQTVGAYGSFPGGVVLEGEASGLENIVSGWYDARYNALVLNGAAYFIGISREALSDLCRAIARDEKGRIGVSLGENQIVYGELSEDSDAAWNMKLADHFLADVVFVFDGRDHWTAGYQFARDYAPEKLEGAIPFNAAVFFRFGGFRFSRDDDQFRLVGAGFDVEIIPLSASRAPDGGLLPDYDAIAMNALPGAWLRNAKHLTDNIDYYGGERLIREVFSMGEASALLRSLKRGGFDLDALGRDLSGE